MRSRFGVGWSFVLGLAILLLNVNSIAGVVGNGPSITASVTAPLRNGDGVELKGVNFIPREMLTGFGAVVRYLPQPRNESLPVYRGFDLTDLQVWTDARGQFRVRVPLEMLSGMRGQIQLALYYHGTVLFTDYLSVADSGPFIWSGLDASTGDLYFDTFGHGGPGEDPVVNTDDLPLTSNSSGGWSGSLFQVNLERYTTTDGTGTSTPYNNVTNDVTWPILGGDLDAGSSAIVAGLSATYKSVRNTVLAWDEGNYGSITSRTTMGSTQGTGYLSTSDVTAPSLSSANATALITITVTFTEAVTTPASNDDAIDNWTVTFNGNKAVTELSPLNTSTTTVTLTCADLGDRGATPTVDFTSGTNEFEDASGNDAVTDQVIASDGIAPATPSLTAPTTNTMMEGASVAWTASAGSGTDNSLAGIKYQGSDDGNTWSDLDDDVSSPYGGTYVFGTKYTYYRARAYDTNSNTANSSSTASLQDAHHLHLTTIPASTPANVESGVWTVSVHDNYGNLETVTQTVALNSSSTSGAFRAISGGASVPYINILNASSGNFYYLDTHAGTYWINVVNASLLDDSTQYSVTENTTIVAVKIRTAAGGGGAETNAIEVAGADNGGSYNVSPWMYAAGYNSLDQYVSDVAANWGVTGSISGGSFTNGNPSISNRYTANAISNQSGTVTATYTSFSDATGTFTVDATPPATVAAFNVSQNQDPFYVNSTWDRYSSYDDGSNAGSGNVADFDIRYSASIINNETAWDAATSVPATGKPLSFNLSGYWEIYMASVPAGYYYYAIKTQDPQGYWSAMGSGCYTTAPDYSLPVTLSSFQADGGFGKITITWSTESEIDALGFRLLRDQAEDFSNPILIASYETDPELLCQGNSATGFDYSYTDQQDLEPETLYYYRLQTVDLNGQIETASTQAFAAAMPFPSEFRISQNYPNPFNPITYFAVTIPWTSSVTLTIYDVRGREVVRLLDNANLEPNIYPFNWNGRNALDQPMPSGLYFCRLQSDNTQLITKMMLVK